LLDVLRKEIAVLRNKVKFLDLVISGDVQLHTNDGDADLDNTLAQHGLERCLQSMDYKYLTSMPLHSLTKKRRGTLQAELANKQAWHDELEATPAFKLWIKDLDAFESEYHAVYGANDRESAPLTTDLLRMGAGADRVKQGRATAKATSAVGGKAKGAAAKGAAAKGAAAKGVAAKGAAAKGAAAKGAAAKGAAAKGAMSSKTTVTVAKKRGTASALGASSMKKTKV
jgi:hypothetical protein